ncbi:MAG: isoprenylcysteine carboxylmethyltransferase family protein [Gammaproteobacteria bacterium]|nr:isoprenylcysteine carboxylmethyltransferase family protein [Gammaproteobacteria bacterium]
MKTGQFELIYLACFVLVSVVRAVGVTLARRQADTKQKTLPKWNLDTLGALLQSLGLFILPFVYLFSDWLDFANFHMPAGPGYIGGLLYLFGIWILWKTHRDLGANWSDSIETRQGQTLVTGGIYSRIRHPMYTAHTVMALGQVLLLGNWIAGPSFLVLQLPFYALRIPAEERRLLQHFGRAYRDYMLRTGRLLPKLG